MTEALSHPNAINDYLDTHAIEIGRLMADAPEASDGTNLNRFDSLKDEQGRTYGIALSVRPNQTMGYHASLQEAPDANGFVENWDYHWGTRKPKVIHTRVHQSRLHSSLMHPVDSREVKPLASVDVQVNIPEIIETYERLRQSLPVEARTNAPS